MYYPVSTQRITGSGHIKGLQLYNQSNHVTNAADSRPIDCYLCLPFAREESAWTFEYFKSCEMLTVRCWLVIAPSERMPI